jgi:hypothetical protein
LLGTNYDKQDTIKGASMTRSVNPESREPDEAGGKTPAEPALGGATGERPVFETNFTEAGGAAVAALLHLIRLMGAELVLMRRDCDPTRFEQAVRSKLEHFTSPTANEHARQAGLTHARHLVEQVLTQIRAQAELKRSLAGGAAQPQPSAAASAPASSSRLLN